MDPLFYPYPLSPLQSERAANPHIHTLSSDPIPFFLLFKELKMIEKPSVSELIICIAFAIFFFGAPYLWAFIAKFF